MSSNGTRQTANFRWYVWLLFLYIPIGALVIYVLREIHCRQQVRGVDVPGDIEISVKPVKATSADKKATKSESPAKPEKRRAIKTDDLKKIEGIGPKISQVLIEANVDTFAKLERMKADDIKAILEEKGVRIGFPETWPEQARLAAQSDWEGLKKLQDSLKGGRKV